MICAAGAQVPRLFSFIRKRLSAMPLPAAAGIGFKPEHFAAIRATRPDLGFIEVHAENYMGAGGLPHRMLEALREDFLFLSMGLAYRLAVRAWTLRIWLG